MSGNSAFSRTYLVAQQSVAVHGVGKWDSQDTPQHVAHAYFHIKKYLDGDRSEDHLAHARIRLDMAMELESS